MAYLAKFVLLFSVATGLTGCAFNHLPDMRAQFDELLIPSSYQFLGETVDEINLELFGLSDLVVTHHYRSPLDFQATCDQVETAFESSMTHRRVEFCQIKALHVGSGWRVGFVSSYVVLVNAFAIPAKADRPRRFHPAEVPRASRCVHRDKCPHLLPTLRLR